MVIASFLEVQKVLHQNLKLDGHCITPEELMQDFQLSVLNLHGTLLIFTKSKLLVFFVKIRKQKLE